MPPQNKYYVSSGDMNLIIMARNPIEAARMAVLRYVDMKRCDDIVEFGTITSISEQGFDATHPNDMIILTETILDVVGLQHNSKIRQKLDNIDEDI